MLLVGDGPQRAELEQWVQGNSLSSQIYFVGRIPHDKVFSFYRCMDVLVLPSYTTPTDKEQFGLVLAEAMLSQVAVVGSSSGEIPHVIGDAGLVFPERDVQALRKCLQQLIDNPEARHELARRGYERAMRKFSTPALADEFYSICQELLAQ